MVESLTGDVSLLLLLAGAVLIVAEAFAPGAHFAVLGVTLLVAGLVGFFLPPGLGLLGLVLLAGLVLGVGAATLYVYRQFDFYGGKGTAQTDDASSLRGKMGRVTERVTPTGGEIKLEGGGFNPYYQARSLDGEIAEGEEVMVIDPGGGNVLTVESVAGDLDEIDRELARGRDRAAAASGDDSTADVDTGASDPGADERDPDAERESEADMA